MGGQMSSRVLGDVVSRLMEMNMESTVYYQRLKV